MASADPGRVPQGDGERIGATTGAVQKNSSLHLQRVGRTGRDDARRRCRRSAGSGRWAARGALSGTWPAKLHAWLRPGALCDGRDPRRSHLLPGAPHPARCGRRARESTERPVQSLFDKVGIGAEMVGDHCAKARFTSVSIPYSGRSRKIELQYCAQLGLVGTVNEQHKLPIKQGDTAWPMVHPATRLSNSNACRKATMAKHLSSKT